MYDVNKLIGMVYTALEDEKEMKKIGFSIIDVAIFTTSLIQTILVSAGDCRFIRLRGGRSSADSARGTRPSGLPSVACGRDGGIFCSLH